MPRAVRWRELVRRLEENSEGVGIVSSREVELGVGVASGLNWVDVVEG